MVNYPASIEKTCHKPGPKPRTHCRRGHDMSIYSRTSCGKNYCGACADQRSIEYQKRNPDKKKLWLHQNDIKRRYGLTQIEYDTMLSSQNNCCAICKTTKWGNRGSPSVDHDHITGKARALLCVRCNIGLGAFQDNIDIIENAIRYISLYRTT